MKFTKKFISVLLAVVLVLGTLSVSAFAWTGDGTQEAKITIVADKTTVSAGETVNFDIVLNLAEGGSWSTFGNFMFSFLYDSTVLTPVSKTYGPTVVDFSSDRALGIVTTASVMTNIKNKSTTEEQALFTTNNYNAMCRIQCMKDANSTYGADGYWTATDGEVLATVTCTVADVPDGTAVHFDYVSGLSSLGYFYLQTIDTANNNKGTIQKSATLYDCTEAVSTTVVGSAEPSLTLLNSKDQVRYGKNSRGEYADQIDVRNVAKIAATEFEAIDVSKITAAGFVYAPSTTAFSAETAQAIAKAGSADGYDGYLYEQVGTIYDEGDYYTFSCLVYGIDDADIATAAYNCYAFLAVDGEYWFFYADDQVKTTSAVSLYNTYLADANAKYGWTLAAK